MLKKDQQLPQQHKRKSGISLYKGAGAAPCRAALRQSCSGTARSLRQRQRNDQGGCRHQQITKKHPPPRFSFRYCRQNLGYSCICQGCYTPGSGIIQRCAFVDISKADRVYKRLYRESHGSGYKEKNCQHTHRYRRQQQSAAKERQHQRPCNHAPQRQTFSFSQSGSNPWLQQHAEYAGKSQLRPRHRSGKPQLLQKYPRIAVYKAGAHPVQALIQAVRKIQISFHDGILPFPSALVNNGSVSALLLLDPLFFKKTYEEIFSCPY